MVNSNPAILHTKLRSKDVSLVVHIAPEGTIYGIELLNANERLRREDTGRLLVINEATGERAKLPLAVD